MGKITVNSQIHGGKPYIDGTSVTVRDVLELLREGLSFDAIVRDRYPELEIEDIRACLQYSIDLIAFADSETLSLERTDHWKKFSGIFKDDPMFDEFVEDMAAYRRQLDAEMAEFEERSADNPIE